jgi:hypothetical protein
MRYFMLFAVALLIIFSGIAFGQDPKNNSNQLNIRGGTVDIYYIPGKADSSHQNYKILFAPGDGGWRGFAITIAKNMASWGYDVYSLDTKQYLSEFTGDSLLKETEIMSDFGEIAEYMKPAINQGIILVGWSEGAGLCLLGGASNDNKKMMKGLITIGLPDSNELGWRLIDNLTYITKKNPNEKMFGSAGYLPQISPLPLFMIQSTGDEYITIDGAKNMFALANEPKRFEIIQSKNHKFGGKTDQLFTTLKESIEWIKKTSQ